jgi:hypothetical protein
VVREPKTVVVLQPMLFPWVGHLEQVRLADAFVHYDDVQYVPRSLANRVRIKTRNGPLWLTVPVVSAGRQAIADVALHGGVDWRRQHLRTLEHAFAKTPFRDDALALVHSVYDRQHGSLAELTIASVQALADYFALRTDFLRSSQLGVAGRATDRLVALCDHLHATDYVTGHGARNYLQADAFDHAGIAVHAMDYQRTPYPQQFGAFDPHVSALDLVANCGRDGRWLIASGTVPFREFARTRSLA